MLFSVCTVHMLEFHQIRRWSMHTSLVINMLLAENAAAHAADGSASVGSTTAAPIVMSHTKSSSAGKVAGSAARATAAAAAHRRTGTAESTGFGSKAGGRSDGKTVVVKGGSHASAAEELPRSPAAAGLTLMQLDQLIRVFVMLSQVGE